MSWIITGTEKYETDPYRSNVSLLLHGDGANGSTSFVDNSLFNHVFTTTGAPVISTAESKFGGSSLFFNGSSSFNATSSTAFSLGSGDFTIEAWVYFNSLPSGGTVLTLFSSTDLRNSLLFGYNAGVTVAYYASSTGTSWDVASSRQFAALVTTDTWHHLALARSGNTLTPYFNGVAGATASSSLPIYPLTDRVIVGGGFGFSNAYIDDLRITKGVARYTSNFTPPTAPFPDI